MSDKPKLLYCHCAYANVIREDVKKEVLQGLCRSDQVFDSVPDLCEMSARKDPKLKAIAEGGHTKIAACHPRAVKWLFHAAGAPLPDDDIIQVMNMRDEPAENVLNELLEDQEVET